MYTSTYINTQGTLRIYAVYYDRKDLIAELHGVMADKIAKTYEDAVNRDFGNTDRNPVSYDFEFSTLI